MPKRIILLVAAHLAALSACTFAAIGRPWPNPAETVLVAIVFAQSGLLGFVCQFAPLRPWIRALFVACGLVCSVSGAVTAEARPISTPEVVFIASLIAAPAAAVYIVLIRIRSGARALCLSRFYARSEATDGFQFTIRHLLIATALVAIVLTGGKAVQEWHLEASNFIGTVTIFAVVVPCLVLVELATFSGSLGIGSPFPRLLIIVPVAFALGLVPPFYFSSEMGWKWYLAWSCVTGGQSLITAGTLLVVRWSGWRLCRASQPAGAD